LNAKGAWSYPSWSCGRVRRIQTRIFGIKCPPHFFFTQIRYSVAVLNNWLYFKVSLLQTGHQHECVFGIKNQSLMAENIVPVS
jgi:hypothetical protein